MGDDSITPAAERDLEGIWTYTAKQWGLDQADRYIDAMVAVFNDLAESPLIAQTCNHVRPGYRRWQVEQHTIYFRLHGTGILVVRVLHQRMLAHKHL